LAIDYVAYNRAGERVTGRLEVESEEEAEERLWARDLLVVELRRAREPREGRSLLARYFPTFFGARLPDVITMTRQLETLLRAGVPLAVGLRQIRDQTRNPGLREALRDIVRRIEGGERFSTACAQHPEVFPSYYLRLLPMAEETGRLPDILRGLLHAMERQQNVASQARRAVVSPLISVTVALVAGAIMFTFVLPRLMALLAEFGGGLPLATRVLIGLSHFSQAHGVKVLVGVIVMVVALYLFFNRTRRGTYLKDRIQLRLPLVGRVVLASTMFDLCSVMALLLRSGVSPVGALRSVISIVGNQVIRGALVRVEAEVSQGGRLGQACRRQPELPALFSDTVTNGKQAGALRQNLEALTDFYQAETERSVAVGTNLLEPILIIAVGAVIGFVVVGIISGIYSIIPQIAKSI